MTAEPGDRPTSPPASHSINSGRTGISDSRASQNRKSSQVFRGPLSIGLAILFVGTAIIGTDIITTSNRVSSIDINPILLLVFKILFKPLYLNLSLNPVNNKCNQIFKHVILLVFFSLNQQQISCFCSNGKNNCPEKRCVDIPDFSFLF